MAASSGYARVQWVLDMINAHAHKHRTAVTILLGIQTLNVSIERKRSSSSSSSSNRPTRVMIPICPLKRPMAILPQRVVTSHVFVHANTNAQPKQSWLHCPYTERRVGNAM